MYTFYVKQKKEYEMNLQRALPLIFACLFLSGCLSGPKSDRVLNITYRDEHYKVPKDEIWKLTWKSPYKSGDIHLAYDVRVLGYCFTTREMGTRINAFSSKARGDGLLDVFAGNTPAEIWVPSNTEFYLANDRIQVSIEAFKNNPLK